MQHHRRILADRIEHHRVFALGRDFAHDVDALGFELLQMGQLHGHCAASETRVTRPSAATCSPHSFLSSFSHHQRPARSGSPGLIARVQGAQPMETKPFSCSPIHRDVIGARIGDHVVAAEVEQRIGLEQITLRVPFDETQV